MKKFLIIYAVCTTLLLTIFIISAHRRKGEIARLNSNCQALRAESTLYRTRLDKSAASVLALQLELDEYREQHRRDVKHIRSLGVRLRRVESVAKSATKSEVAFTTPHRDTIIVYDTVSLFSWSDRWITAKGAIHNGEVECRIESIDTLRQVIHRIPRRFGLIRYGTKAIRQEITSSNPHSKVVYTEYIELPKRRRER